jgi:hypothetical protein
MAVDMGRLSEAGGDRVNYHEARPNKRRFRVGSTRYLGRAGGLALRKSAGIRRRGHELRRPDIDHR